MRQRVECSRGRIRTYDPATAGLIAGLAGQTCDFVETVASFLALQFVFELTSFGIGELFADPNNAPWTSSFCPRRLTSIVLSEPTLWGRAHSDVKFRL